MAPWLSVVVPLYNEEANVLLLAEAVARALDGWDWELLLVDDGSSDGTARMVQAAAELDARIRPVLLARNYGQTTAMQAGFDTAAGEVIVSMDGDLQNDPADIPLLVQRLGEGFDLVSGYRAHRQDAALTRKLPSWFANRMIRAITRVSIRDNGCSLKAFRRTTLERIRLYADMHRFIPAVAVAMAGARVTEIPVRHHPRRYGQSKYGLSRIVKVALDLLTITLISWFRDRPLQFFGGASVLAFLVCGGFGIGTFLGYLHGPATVSESFILPASTVLWFLLACFLLLAGLMSEVALLKSREEADDPPMLVAERLL